MTGFSDLSHLMSRVSPEDERPGDARCIVLSCLPSELGLPLGMPCLAESISFFRFLLPAPHCMMAMSFGTDSYKIPDGVARIKDASNAPLLLHIALCLHIRTVMGGVGLYICQLELYLSLIDSLQEV